MALPAPDNVDTLPVDVMALPAPSDLGVEPSPNASTEDKRRTFQRLRQKTPAEEVNLPADESQPSQEKPRRPSNKEKPDTTNDVKAGTWVCDCTG